MESSLQTWHLKEREGRLVSSCLQQSDVDPFSPCLFQTAAGKLKQMINTSMSNPSLREQYFCASKKANMR